MINLKDQSSLTPGMGYVNLISDDWKTTSHGSHCKQSLSTDGGDIKIILSNQESGVETEKIIKNSTQLKTVFNDYAGEYGESLRSLRFSYNGSTLFLSSLGQKTANDIGMQDSDVICIYDNNSTLEAKDFTPQDNHSCPKRRNANLLQRELTRLERSPSLGQSSLSHKITRNCKWHTLFLYTKFTKRPNPSSNQYVRN